MRVTHKREPLRISPAILWDRRRTLPRYAEGFSELLAEHVEEAFRGGPRRSSPSTRGEPAKPAGSAPRPRAMKLANSGCGSKGRDFSSGWNCTPMNQGWSGSSMISGSRPSGDRPAEAHAGLLQLLAILGVDLVAVAVALGDLRLAVDLGDLAALGQRGGIGAEPHGAAEVAVELALLQLVAAHPFRHQADHRLGRSAPNSVEPAFSMPTRSRAASITAICMPKQMPK